jgi:hypothetical protein
MDQLTMCGQIMPGVTKQQRQQQQQQHIPVDSVRAGHT